MNKKEKKIVIATGGTGGHVFPAYSLAQYFLSINYNVKITSDSRGLKFLRYYSDINFFEINTSSIFNRNILESFFSFLKVFYSIVKSLKFLLFEKPDVVFGMGGYSSFPVCLAAKILKIPFIIYENNLLIGKANRYLLPFAYKVFVSCKELEGISKKYENKIYETGNIIRKEIFNIKNKSKDSYNNKVLKILILGGSQAAKVFAEELPKIFYECKKENTYFKIYQQCLPEQNSNLESFYKKENIDHEIFNFGKNILEYFSQTDFAITRSGASMLAELINSRIPFISVPLPTSADDHQLKNAMYYKKKGYSYLVEEKDLKIKLKNMLISIDKDRKLLETIRDKQSDYSDKLVFERISKVVQNML